jgi:hypothetical protein
MEINDRRINKLKSFLTIYEQLFAPFKKKKITIMELGVQGGGSLELWKQLIPEADIIGVDSDERCKEITGFEIRICHQADPRLADREYDIIIDDGGHLMSQQKNSFNLLYPKLKPGGMYIIEDLETSYWGDFIDEEPTTINYLKSLVDSINSEYIKHPRSDRRDIDYPSVQLNSITFYDNLCVIKK